MTPPKPLLVANPILRYALFVVGCLSVALGVLGIFLPLLPTTPFILLAGACFARSSESFYRWITSHPRFGPMIANYLAGRGLPRKAKRMALLLMWTSITVGCLWVDFVWARVAMLLTAAAVSLYILRLPTLEADTNTAAKPSETTKDVAQSKD